MTPHPQCEGEPEWDEGPEHEGEIFDISPTFYRAPSSLDPNDVGKSSTPTGWKAYGPPISQTPIENEEAIPVPEPGSPSLSVGTLNRARRLCEGLNYSGRGSLVRGHPYVIAFTGGEGTWKPVITFREHCEDRFTVLRLFLLRTF